MKTFRITADFRFEADNVDDAVVRLIRHLEHIHKGKDSKLVRDGEVSIMPVRDSYEYKIKRTS